LVTAYRAPSGPDWVHEIKHDGYRLQVRREGDAVQLFTRRGYNWSGRYPSIAVTATLLRARSFTLDGEAVVCGPDGVAVFDALHRRGTLTEAMLYGFDLLELDRIIGSLIGGLKFADAGVVPGSGDGRADNVLARVSPREVIINAKSTAAHRTVLEEINAGVRLPRFAHGGLVRPMLSRMRDAAAPSSSGGRCNHVVVNVSNNAPGTTTEAQKRRLGGVDVHDIVVKAVGDHMANGGFNGVIRARFGQQVQPRSR
jgi:hypothetical protein